MKSVNKESSFALLSLKAPAIALLSVMGFFIPFALAQAAIPSSGLVGSFDGATTTSVPHTSSIDPESSLWTVSALVKGTSDGTIIWKGGSPDYYELAVNGGRAVFTINAGGTTVTASAVSSASINDGNWHSITGVRSTTKTVDVYVDGVFSGTATYSGSGTAIDTTTSLTISSRNGANNFSGNIGNIYLYNRALSVSEIQDIYSTDIGAGQTSPPPVNNTDTTTPSVNITSPSAGGIVSGSVSISANASDNVAVLGVQFKINGINIGNEDTISPYQATWDSTSVPNGSHTISVVTRDAAGNTSANSVNVSVNNSVSSPPPSGCSYPAQILDLTNWKVTMPENTSHAGAPDEYFQPELSTYSNNAYFKVNSSCDGVQFLAPTSGYTTSGSSYPRSELREMTGNGTVNASWGTNDGKPHTMFIDQAITAVPTTKKHIVVGQIHDAADDVIVIRLEYPKLFVDINGVEGPTLDANYTLGKRFTVKFVSSEGQTKIYYNGSTTPAHTLSKNGSGYYFKAGAYTQSNCSKEASCSPSNYGEVHIYNLWVSHSSDNPPQNSTPPVVNSGGSSSGGGGSSSGGVQSGAGGAGTANTGGGGGGSSGSNSGSGDTINTSLQSSTDGFSISMNNNPQSTTTTTAVLTLQPFTKYLHYGITDTDVKRLQVFLNQDPDTKLSNYGAGSLGKETNFFGPKTLNAVKKFQEKYFNDVLAHWNLKKGTGFVGKTTLSKINELINKIK